MTGKDDVSAVRHKTAVTDNGFGGGIIERNVSRMLTSALWRKVFKRRLYAFSPLTLFYLSLSAPRSSQTVNMLLNLNAYLSFLMKTESMKSDLTAQALLRIYKTSALSGSIPLLTKHGNIHTTLSRMDVVAPLPSLAGEVRGDYSRLNNSYGGLLMNSAERPFHLIFYHRAVFSDRLEDKMVRRDILERAFPTRKTDSSPDGIDKAAQHSPSKFNRAPLASRGAGISEKICRSLSLQHLASSHKHNEYFRSRIVSKRPFLQHVETGREGSPLLDAERTLSSVLPVTLKNRIQPGRRENDGFRQRNALREFRSGVHITDSLYYRDTGTIHNRRDVTQRLPADDFRSNNLLGNSAPGSLRLDYFHPAADAVKENKPAVKISESIDVTVNKNPATTGNAGDKPQINIDSLANEVYRLLENKLRIEKERRGIFR